MSLLNMVLTVSDQDLVPDVRPEEIPNTDPFTKEEEDEDRRPDEEVWDEEDEEEG